MAENFSEKEKSPSAHIFRLVKKIYVKEGMFRGFYKGMTINFFKVSSSLKLTLRGL